MKKNSTLENALVALQKQALHSPLSIGQIVHVLSEQGKSLILLLLALPFCQPIQVPGLSSPFGIAILFIGLQIAMGKPLWLPQWIMRKNLSSKVLKKLTHILLRLMKSLQKWLHPRWGWMSRHSFMHIVNGIIIALLGVFLTVPIPIPFCNMIAAWGIVFLSLGLLKDDGLFVSIGYVFFLGTVAFCFLIPTLIKDVV